MSLVPAINTLSSAWLCWVADSLLNGSVALGLVMLGWCLMRKRLRPRYGAWLFVIVLLKCVLPFKVEVPVLKDLPSASVNTALAVEARVLPDVETSLLGMHSSSVKSASDRTSESWSASSLLLLLWISAMWLGVLRVQRCWRKTRSLMERTLPADQAVMDLLDPLLTRLGTPLHAVTIRVSNELRSPAVVGWRRAVLLLPQELSKCLTPEQYRWAVAHELAHIRAGDVLWQWVDLGFRIVFCFHPAVWLGTWQSARLREQACDEEAVEISGTSRQHSAEGFLALIEWAQRPEPVLGLSLGHAGREARERIRALARSPLGRMARHRQIVFTVMAAAIVLPSYRFTYAQAGTAAAGENPRIVELEKRVAELEQKLQAKSRLELLREKAVLRANARAQADSARFTPEELREIERIYQTARKSTHTTEELAQAWQPLFDRFPQANRTGCAVLLLARQNQGANREALLRKAATEHGDAYFLDATSVGGVARLMLARDADAAGRAAEAQQWRAEIRRDYGDDLDFGAVPLLDLINSDAAPE